MHDEVHARSLQNLLDNALDPILVVIGTQVILANAPAVAVTGYDAEELQALTLEGLVHPDGREVIEDLHSVSLPNSPTLGPFYTLLVCKNR